MQLNKSIKNFINYFLGPLLFLWLFFSIYKQINKQPRLSESWQHIKEAFGSHRIFYFFLVLVLLFVNWGIEAWKWKLSLKHVYPVKFLRAFEAVLSGVSFSVTMPNRVGEYLGRMMYLPEGNRLRTISVTLVGSFAQVLITLWAGLAGMRALKTPLLAAYPAFGNWYMPAFWLILLVTVLLTLLYFKVAAIELLLEKTLKNKKYQYLVESLRKFNAGLLIQLMLLSFLRYGVFLLQYILLFHLFEVRVPVATMAAVMNVVFLILAIVPSIALVEVGIRGEVSIKLMGLFTMNSLGVGLTSITIWFINLILPAIAGSLLMLNIKVFAKKDDKIKA